MITRTSGSIAKSLRREVQEARQHPNIIIGFANYGEMWPILNGLSSGIKSRVYTILAARPKVGKTMLLCGWIPWIAAQAQLVGKKVRIVTLETRRKAFMRRVAAILAGIDDPVNIRRGMISEEELERYLEALNWLETLPIEVMSAEDDPNVDPMSTSSAITYRAITKFIGQPDTYWWCIDHIGLIDADGQTYRSLPEKITELSIALSRFSHRVVGGMVVTHLTRESTTTGGRPTISHLANSDQLTKDGDEIFILDRPWYQPRRPLTEEDMAYMRQIGGEPASLEYNSRDEGHGIDFLFWSNKRVAFSELREQPEDFTMPLPGQVNAPAQPVVPPTRIDPMAQALGDARTIITALTSAPA